MKRNHKSVSEGDPFYLIPSTRDGETAHEYNLRRQKEIFGINDEEAEKFQQFRNSFKGRVLFFLDKLTGRNFYDRSVS